jgi:methanogenic corrinoid protein MtbC1
VLPYLRDVGERWADGHLNVAQEHFTSTFLEARFMAMARGWDRGLGPRALLACPAGERHTFGLVSFGIALHDAGWRIVHLGADTPLEMIRYVAAEIRPELVALSAVDGDRFSDERAIRALADRWRVALAGAGANAQLSARLAARHLGQDPVSAAFQVHAAWN